MAVVGSGEESGGNITHIGGEDGSVTIVSNVDYSSVALGFGGVVMRVAGIFLLVFINSRKKDFIEIEGDKITCQSRKQKYSFSINDVASCTSTKYALSIKRKFDTTPIHIIYIENGFEIAKQINELMRKK